MPSVFGGFIVGVIYVANTGLEHPGTALVRVLPYGDKLGHIVLWGVLTFLVNLALGWRIAIATVATSRMRKSDRNKRANAPTAGWHRDRV